MKDQPVEISAGVVEATLEFFASVKLTVALLLTLAVTSIIGTLIPQNESPQVYFQAFGDFFYRLFSILDLFDMYHSWWFQFLVLLLTLNILVCSIDRLSSIWKIVFVAQPPFKLSRFRRLKHRAAFTSPGGTTELQTVYEPLVARRFRYRRWVPTDDGVCLFAERWRWTRLGVYVVHTSVILLLIGGLIGSIFGFEGFVNIPEGESANTIRLRNSGRVQTLDFDIRCDDFDVSFYANGAPKEFRSSLSLLEAGKLVRQKDIIVNDPLRYRGISLYQSSYGQLSEPAPSQSVDPPEKITLKFLSQDSGMAYEERAAIGEQIDIPENQGTFVVKLYKKDALFGGQSIGETLIGMLTPPGGDPIEVTLPVHFPNFDKMRGGPLMISVVAGDDWAQKPSAHGAEKRYYTGLQVTKDPGVWVVYSGFILMIAGCFITFFMSHQQICIEMTPKGKQTRVTVSGLSNRNRLAMRTKVDAIAEQLARRVPAVKKD